MCVKICKYFDFGKNCRKISSLVNFYGNLDVAQSLWISRFCSKLSWNLDLGQRFRKILILVNIFIKIDLGRNFPKSWFWSKFSKNVDLCKKNLQICRLGQKFPTKIWSNLSKILILVKIIENTRFWSKLEKISILVKIYKNLEFGWAHPGCFAPHHGELGCLDIFPPVAGLCIRP